jgi:hypothetical protein
MRVYVAGAYSGTHVLDILENIRKGINLSKDVLLIGHYPFCPWADFLFDLVLKDKETISMDMYYNYSIAWLEVSDCMLLVTGWENSNGTKNEIVKAHEWNIPVFETIDELMEFSIK